MVSIIIPALFPSPSLSGYVSRLVGYKSVKRVIVVVNGKNDVKGVLRQTQDDTVKAIFLGNNTGFTGACNAGARVATGKYLLFLNDDCEMTETSLQKLVAFLDENETVVATQPIVTKATVSSSRNQVENIGFWIDTKIGKASPIISQEEIEAVRGEDKIYGLSGTCLLIRKDIFEKVGKWDESFHSYLEDVDLALRLQKIGYKVAPCLDAEVTHAHMATSSKMGLYKEKQDVKNWWRLVFKHHETFVRLNSIFPLLLERVRNLNGLLKKIFKSVLQ